MLCQVRDINSKSRVNALARKQAQLSTMHNYDFSDKGRAIKGLVVWWMLLILISLGVRVLHPIALHVDDHSNRRKIPPLRGNGNGNHSGFRNCRLEVKHLFYMLSIDVEFLKAKLFYNYGRSVRPSIRNG